MTARESPDVQARIPSLDGLRAFSIALVLFSHSMIAAARTSHWPLPAIATPGATGVAVFFAISGFIITTLLLREHDKSGTIDLRAFYVRRAFRILPALWVFLGVSALVAPAIPPSTYARALFFLTDYWFPRGWWLGHTWSLSVEEQFYLLWPLAMALLGPARSMVAAAGLVLAGPLLRVGAYFALPGLRGDVSYNFHTNVDAIMIGCLLALVRARAPGAKLARFAARADVAAFSAVFLLVIHPLLSDLSPGKYVVSVGLSLRALATGSIIAWATSASGGVVWRALNARSVTHIGLISYSLYLWQQPFFDPSLSGRFLGHVPVALLAAFVAAEMSYRLVERPALAARSLLGRVRPNASASLSPP